MPKKLAITFAGAVSLGSYESGVVYEILNAIEQHNANPATADADRIEIDVLTGASAGGMTAIILAQKLLFYGDQFEDPYNNPLYNIWVKRITLAGLQDTQPDEPALHSIFSSDLIETISHEALTARYASGSPSPLPAPVKHGAAAAQIRLGAALSNLNGLAYGYDVLPDGKFIYINGCDQRTRLVDPADPKVDTLAFWEPMREAAVACGAFPFAFRAQNIQRFRKTDPDSVDYQSGTLQDWPQEPMNYTYSDGGIFQNQPLGIAKNLVDLVDCHENQDRRFYLFVSPNAKDPLPNLQFEEKDANYFKMLQRLLGAVIGQSGFQDWVTAMNMNERIAKLDERARELAQVILKSEIDLDALEKTAASLLKLFFPGGSHLPPGASQPETLAQALNRISNQYATEIKSLAGIPGAGDAFRDSILAFESAAGLGARDSMIIYGLTATDSELAGAGLQAFLGFFDQKFRDHDYDTGRTHARNLLTSASFQAGPLGPVHYNPLPIHAVDHSLDGLKLSKVPSADMDAFKTGLKKRVNQMVHELITGWGSLFNPLTDQVADRILDALIHHLISQDDKAVKDGSGS